MVRIRRRPFVEYDEALKGFTNLRRELNNLAEEDREAFLKRFEELKDSAVHEDAIAMDVLAYFYKTGVEGILPENYMRYITWELVSAGRGNQLAIEKLQFLIGYACDAIIRCEDYNTIVYKNDIDDYNLLYVLGKAVAKMIVRDLQAFPVDLVELQDDFLPFKQEYYVTLRKKIDDAIPKTIEFLKS